MYACICMYMYVYTCIYIIYNIYENRPETIKQHVALIEFIL